ncbi:vacuolar protein [Musa troglodytarum]|uniref:Vacuolar protein n=1 Tax=Musa troglodytarum TaxID=320322 RepID=A0A9E7HWQ6_9LILI|nr:vacuolar protein [Musa troglodytarum]
MLEDKVAFLLQKYLGNYVRGLSKEALKISVWQGDVELSNMQLRPEALNALKLPVKVKAGFLGSVKLKVPWSRLGQEPVLVYLDRILLLAEPATQIEGCSEDAVQEAKKNQVKELEMKLLESQQQLKSEMNTSWLGSLINTIIGNLKLSITNIHIRYEDTESNPGHPFAAALKLSRLSAVTIDDFGKETFATGGALDRIQKSVELESLAFYFDSDVIPWTIDEPWEDLLPSEWSKDGYRDILKMAENFAAFNQRLRYAHYRPSVSVKSDPLSWWKYAYKVVMDETKKASGKFSWEHVLKYARLRKRYIALYASLLKSDLSHMVVDDNKEIEELDRELDIDVILQWRMLAHKFVEQMAESDLSLNKKKAKQSWWSFGRTGSTKDDSEHRGFTEEDWQQLNKLIGYKEGSNDYQLAAEEKDFIHLYLEIHMKHNASKLVADGQKCLAELSCEGLDCNIKTYPEAKVFDLKLGSYKLSSPYGLLAESATAADSLVGIFSYKPFDVQVDWSFVAKSSPCYITYIKESVGQVVAFFKSSSSISQTLALETAAAVQMTIDGVKRTAQEQMSRVLKEQSRFLLNLDIAAPKVTIPTKFYPDDLHATQLLLDLGNLMLTTDDYWECDTSEEKDLYLQFNLVLSDVSAFLVDDDYHWGKTSLDDAAGQTKNDSFLQVIEKCGIVVNFQQVFINSLRGKHVHQVPTEFTGGVQNVLAVYDAGQYNSKVVEDTNALILLCDDNEDLGTWQKRLQGAIYRASGPATISSISEISSPAETTKGKSYDIAPTLDVVYMERLFVTGVLDELRVELSMREKNIFIGTVLKSLEIEDQFCHEGGKTPRYIARSFINSEEATALHNLSSFTDIGADKIKNNSFKKSDSEKFFEALDDLDDLVDNFSGQDSFPSPKLSLKPPSFCRIPGLTPDAELQTWSLNLNRNDMLDSFVKAQIVIYDQSSSHYNNLDNKVMVTLATLSFFFHRPTILATLEFFNAINISEENDNADEIIQKTPLDRSSQSVLANEANTTIFEESKVKGLLGSGKTRIIFHLTLDMAMAQIFLMNEDGTSFATLSQNNLLTDIEVFPSSFSIKAALGNLKISDDSVPSNHPYFWVCDMRDPGGSSFVELNFSSFSTDDDDYMGYDYSLTGQFSEVRIVYLNRFVQEVISYFVGLLPSNAEGVVKLKDQVTNSEKWVSKSEIEGSPAIKLDLSLSRPIILMPRHTRSLDYLELDVLQITVHNSFQWLGEDKTEMSAVHQETMFIKPPFASMQSTC